MAEANKKITKEELTSGVNNAPISGCIFLTTYEIREGKNNNMYMVGELISEVSIPFKAWGNSAAYTKLNSNDYKNTPVFIKGKFNIYNDTLSIIIDDLSAINFYSQSDFMAVKYPDNTINVWASTLKNVCEKQLTTTAFGLACKILFDNTEVMNKFKVEYAAKNHHDNCKGGLLGHTCKVVTLMNQVLALNPNLYQKKAEIKDLYVLGALLHDIGKIWEINEGEYNETYAVVTHRYVGMELINNYKKEISDAYGVDWYYKLASIILQHHGEFGDPCRSVYAYVVNLVDILEAKTTQMADAISVSMTNKINLDGVYLAF